MIAWNNSILEPVIITFNRADYLQKTLQAFLEAGLTSIKLFVLDNASTDNTAEIVAAFQQQWPLLQYRRNKYNIGGNANILRAVELSDSTYHWVIGDDDEWHLNDLTELVTVLNEARVDVIRLGWLSTQASEGRYCDAKNLIAYEPLFLGSLGMISATIVRRSLVTEFLAQAYTNIADAYPQLVPFFMKLNKSSFSVYTLAKAVMVHTPSQAPGYYFGDLEWYAAWFRSARYLEDKWLRAEFINSVTLYMIRPQQGALKQMLWLLKVVLNFKALRIPQAKYLMNMLTYGTGWRGRILMISLIYALTPGCIARLLRKSYLHMKGQSDKPLQYDKTR